MTAAVSGQICRWWIPTDNADHPYIISTVRSIVDMSR